MEIKDATKKDLKSISKIFLTEFGRSPYNEKWDLKKAYKRISGYFNAKSIIKIATINKNISGFVIFNKGVWWFGERKFVEEIVVLKKFQNKGIGRALMKEVEKSFKRSIGTNQIYLLTDKRTRAFGFYKKLGYQVTPWVLVKKEWKS